MAVVKTSDEARDLLRVFAEKHGITVSALLEAVARRLPGGEGISAHHIEVVSEARAIDAERRRRD